MNWATQLTNKKIKVLSSLLLSFERCFPQYASSTTLGGAGDPRRPAPVSVKIRRSPSGRPIKEPVEQAGDAPPSAEAPATQTQEVDATAESGAGGAGEGVDADQSTSERAETEPARAHSPVADEADAGWVMGGLSPASGSRTPKFDEEGQVEAVDFGDSEMSREDSFVMARKGSKKGSSRSIGSGTPRSGHSLTEQRAGPAGGGVEAMLAQNTQLKPTISWLSSDGDEDSDDDYGRHDTRGVTDGLRQEDSFSSPAPGDAALGRRRTPPLSATSRGSNTSRGQPSLRSVKEHEREDSDVDDDAQDAAGHGRPAHQAKGGRFGFVFDDDDEDSDRDGSPAVTVSDDSQLRVGVVDPPRADDGISAAEDVPSAKDSRHEVTPELGGAARSPPALTASPATSDGSSPRVEPGMAKRPTKQQIRRARSREKLRERLRSWESSPASVASGTGSETTTPQQQAMSPGASPIGVDESPAGGPASSELERLRAENAKLRQQVEQLSGSPEASTKASATRSHAVRHVRRRPPSPGSDGGLDSDVASGAEVTNTAADELEGAEEEDILAYRYSTEPGRVVRAVTASPRHSPRTATSASKNRVRASPASDFPATVLLTTQSDLPPGSERGYAVVDRTEPVEDTRYYPGQRSEGTTAIIERLDRMEAENKELRAALQNKSLRTLLQIVAHDLQRSEPVDDIPEPAALAVEEQVPASDRRSPRAIPETGPSETAESQPSVAALRDATPAASEHALPRPVYNNKEYASHLEAAAAAVADALDPRPLGERQGSSAKAVGKSPGRSVAEATPGPAHARGLSVDPRPFSTRSQATKSRMEVQLELGRDRLQSELSTTHAAVLRAGLTPSSHVRAPQAGASHRGASPGADRVARLRHNVSGSLSTLQDRLASARKMRGAGDASMTMQTPRPPSVYWANSTAPDRSDVLFTPYGASSYRTESVPYSYAAAAPELPPAQYGGNAYAMSYGTPLAPPTALPQDMRLTPGFGTPAMPPRRNFGPIYRSTAAARE